MAGLVMPRIFSTGSGYDHHEGKTRPLKSEKELVERRKPRKYSDERMAYFERVRNGAERRTIAGMRNKDIYEEMVLSSELTFEDRTMSKERLRNICSKIRKKNGISEKNNGHYYIEMLDKGMTKEEIKEALELTESGFQSMKVRVKERERYYRTGVK